MTNSPIPPDAPPDSVLAAFGLAGGAVARIEQGLINRHWLVTHNGERTVLRRYHPSRSAAAVAWEQRLVEWANAKGWPVAAPRATADGDTFVAAPSGLWAAAPFLEGEPDLQPGTAGSHIRGRLLARLHHDLAAFDVPGQRPGLGKTWEIDACLEPSGAGTFHELLARFAAEHRDLAALIRRQRYRNLRELSRLQYPDLPDLPIHGDFHRGNLLWREGRLTGLLDFDFARRDALVCDLAILLVPSQPLDPRLAGPLLDGYEAVRPLSDTEWELLPALARGSLLWWVSLLLATWRTGTDPRALDGITRTMTVRMPALDAWEPALRALRPPPHR
ncbi:MAG: phosphotransferase [Chloroflexi bacterium]|nr:phosphotransferase [Chloroflexota bacterium]